MAVSNRRDLEREMRARLRARVEVVAGTSWWIVVVERRPLEREGRDRTRDGRR